MSGQEISLVANLDEARRHLRTLDPKTDRFVFQTFDDCKNRKDPRLARTFHGTIDEHAEALTLLNQRGAGIFVTVNDSLNGSRSKQDMTSARAMFREADAPDLPSLPIELHLVIETSPGKKHEYIMLDPTTDFNLWEGVLQTVVNDYGGDPAAKGRNRVLRLAGFHHMKDPANPHPVRIIHENGADRITLDELAKVIPPAKRNGPATADRILKQPKATVSEMSAYARAALDGEVERVRLAAEGLRNYTLNRAAFSLGQLVAGGELSADMAETALFDAAMAAGLPEGEAMRTIQSGMAGGSKEPRQAPEPRQQSSFNAPTNFAGFLQQSKAESEVNLDNEPKEIQQLRNALDVIPANAVFERHKAESVIGWTGHNLWAKPADESGFGSESWEPNTPDWPTLGKKAFRGLAADFVALAARNSEADPAAILVTFLVRFGVEVGPDVYMNVGDTRHKARLAAVIVGASSKARKGTSGRPVTKLFDFSDIRYGDGEQYRSARFSKGPFSSGEGIIFAVRDAATKWNIKEQTEEVADPGVEDKRLFVLDEEFGGVLANTKREGNILSMVIRSAWDSGNFDPLTKNNKTTATGGHIGWVSHITLQELHAKLGESEGFNGFSNRILWWCARREKLVPIPEPMPEAALQEIRERLIGILGSIGKGSEVRLSTEAQDAWVYKYYADLTKDRPGLSGCVTNRGEAQALRLAMIYALLDGKTTISLDHLEAGIAVWDYCSQSARYIFHGRQADTVAQTILEALQKNPMTGTDIFRLFSNNVSKERLEAALAGLVAANRVMVEEQKQPKGRPTKLYRFLEEPHELNEANELNATKREIEPIKFVNSFNSLSDVENTSNEEDANAEYF